MMGMSESELSRRASELGRTVADLGDSIAELTARTEGAEERQRRSRKILQVVVVGVVLNIGLSVLVFLTFRNEGQLRSEVLCPLYQIMQGSHDPAARESMTPEQQAKYDDAFAVIRQGAAVLGCPE
jgi:flagellar basal body-associated protein FliL